MSVTVDEDLAAEREPSIHFVGDRDLRGLDRTTVTARCGATTEGRHATSWPWGVTCRRCVDRLSHVVPPIRPTCNHYGEPDADGCDQCDPRLARLARRLMDDIG